MHRKQAECKINFSADKLLNIQAQEFTKLRSVASQEMVVNLGVNHAFLTTPFPRVTNSLNTS